MAWRTGPHWSDIEMEHRPMAVSSDMILVHRYLYYVLGRPIITDQEYDKLESELPDGDPVKESVGSDRECDYTQKVKKLAQGLLEAYT